MDDQLTLFAEEPPASPLALPDSEREWMTAVATWRSSFADLLIDSAPVGSFGKMSPASCRRTEDGTLEAFVGALVELRYGVFWRILDAQHTRVSSHPRAVPQRRRRVWVIGYLGDWRPPVAVCAEPEGLRRNPAPRREAGKAVAALTAGGVGTCGADDNHAQHGHLIAGHVPEVAPTIPSSGPPYSGVGNSRVEADAMVAQAVTAKWEKGYGGPAGDECQNLVVAPAAPPLTGNHYGDHESREDLLVAGTLTARATPQGHGEAGPRVEDAAANHLVAFTPKDSGQDAAEDVSPTLRAMAHEDSHPNGGGQVAVALDAKQNDVVYHGEKAVALDTQGHSQAVAIAENQRGEVVPVGGDGSVSSSLGQGGGKPGQGYPAVLDVAGTLHGGSGERGYPNGTDAFAEGFAQPTDDMMVRRLTPLECERLQGFEPGHTLVEYRGKPMADGPRYRMLGNAWAVNVARWLGERIQLCEEVMEEVG